MDRIQNHAAKTQRPIRVVQFGEGNFLRAFVDYMFDIANERGLFDGNIVIVKPIARGELTAFNEQDCLYTVILRGQVDGKTVEDERLITSVDSVTGPYEEDGCLERLARIDTLQYIVSNTPEAGIALTGTERLSDRPAASFPGKLTQLLYARWQFFSGAADKGVTMLPVELIDQNGRHLKECVMTLAERWGLEAGFVRWLNESCRFCSTLVDRIVTGHPAESPKLEERLGYQDKLLDVGEPFALWVIQCPDPDALSRALPFKQAGLPVVFTTDLTPYRERKVRILNGAHTSSVLAAYLAGEDIVRNMMRRPLTRAFVERAVYLELLPTVPLPKDEVRAFAEAVMERFENPFIDHALLSISLNSVSKWRARVLPALKDTVKATGQLPRCLTFSLAALIAFYAPVSYENGQMSGAREGVAYPIRDDEPVLAFFWAHKDGLFTEEFAREFAAREDFWGEDLTKIPGFCECVGQWLKVIRAEGMTRALEAVVEEK